MKDPANLQSGEINGHDQVRLTKNASWSRARELISSNMQHRNEW